MKLSVVALVATYHRPRELDRLLDLHERGLEDATDRIWRLLNFQIWGDVFLTGRGAQRWDGIFALSAAQV